MLWQFRALLLASICSLSVGIPLEFNIKRREVQCIVEYVEAGEDVTFSFSVIGGNPLQAGVKIDGPIATDNNISSTELKKAVEDQRHVGLDVEIFRDINFAEPSPYRAEGDPVQHARAIKVTGIYRLCLENHVSNNNIVALMDIRKSSELGKVDIITGHVPTYETLMILQSLSFEEDNSLKQVDAVKEEAMAQARDKLKELRKTLDLARTKQYDYKNRLELHKVINENTYSRMVVRSLFETMIFMAVTGYQLYLVRKWFSNLGPMGMLGSPTQRKTFY